MNIALDIRNIGRQRTGDEVVFLNLVKNLARIDERNNYFLLTDSCDVLFIEKINTLLGIKNKKNFYVVSLPSRNKFIWNLYTVPYYLRTHVIDLYHTQYITPFFVPRRIKIFTHIHDVSFVVYPKYISHIDLFFLRFLIPISMRRTSKIIAVSQFTRDEIVRIYNIQSEKVVIVRNGLSEYFMKKSEFSHKDMTRVRDKYKLPVDFILYVGTLQPRKNLPYLITAFAHFKKKIPSDMRLVLVGNRFARHFDHVIDQKIKEYGLEKDVFFPGYIDQEDLPILYKLAHFFVFPSLYEGFGIPLLEAQAQSLIVLAADLTVFHEVCGDSCFYFPLNNLDEFVEKIYTITMLSREKRQKYIDRGLENTHRFSWEDSARDLLSSYES